MSRKQKIPVQNGREIKQLVHGILPAYRQPEMREEERAGALKGANEALS